MRRCKNSVEVWRGVSTLIIGLLAAVGPSACSRDVRLAGKKIPHVQPRAVEHYGIKLDESATPEQVAYVLLRAIHDDVNAATAAEREAALNVQFDACAPDAIFTTAAPSKATRDEILYLIVSHWAPALAHYADSFAAPFEPLRSHMRSTPMRVARSGEVGCTVLVAGPDPDEDPNAAVFIILELTQVKTRDADRSAPAAGDEAAGLWRVYSVGFQPSIRPGPVQDRRTTGAPGAATESTNGR